MRKLNKFEMEFMVSSDTYMKSYYSSWHFIQGNHLVFFSNGKYRENH